MMYVCCEALRPIAGVRNTLATSGNFEGGAPAMHMNVNDQPAQFDGTLEVQ
jgi:hypothetical protein